MDSMPGLTRPEWLTLTASAAALSRLDGRAIAASPAQAAPAVAPKAIGGAVMIMNTPFTAAGAVDYRFAGLAPHLASETNS